MNIHLKQMGGLRVNGIIKNSSDECPLISIITIVYNGEANLEQTILSVINQSYKNIEYIIIDGCSKDGTIDIIKKYEEKIDIWISEPDFGIYDAMNKGITSATGELIGIINSDDWYEQDALEIIVEQYKKFPKVDVFHGILRFVRDEEEYFLRGSNCCALRDGLIEHPTFFIKNEIYKRIGLYSLEYKSASDFDFIYNLYFKKACFLFIPKVISNFRMGGISNSYIGQVESLLVKRKFGLITIKKYYFTRFILFLRIAIGSFFNN